MIAKRRSARRPLESVIQDALWSEEGIDYRAGWSADVTSVWSLCIVAVGQIAKLIEDQNMGMGIGERG
jgi:hypothetical protein